MYIIMSPSPDLMARVRYMEVVMEKPPTMMIHMKLGDRNLKEGCSSRLKVLRRELFKIKSCPCQYMETGLEISSTFQII